MSPRFPSALTRAPFDRRTSRRSLLGRGLAVGAAGLTGSLAGRSSARAQDRIELTFMHWGSLLEKEEMAKSIEAFQEANGSISVDQIHVPGDYDTKLNTLVAANDLPDLFYQGEAQALEWALEGRVLEMTPYVEQYPQLQNRLPQSFYYFEPGRTIGTMLAGEMTTLYYNRDLFDEADVPYPPAEAANAYTWDQFVEAAKLLTVDNNGRNAADPEFDPENIKQFGVTFPKWWLAWYPLIRGNGADIADESGTQYTLNSAEAADVFQKLQDLIFVHRVSPTPTQSENIPATNQQLQTRRVAMAIDGQWALLDVAQAGVNFGMGVLPKLQEPLTMMLCNVTSINAETENLEAAVQFYLFHNDPERNVDPFASGLWMPLERKYYEDEAFIAKWTDNDAHPPEYRTAVIDYTLNHSVGPPSGSYKNFPALDSRIAAGLDNIWNNKQTAQEALDELAAAAQPELKGRYPSA